MKFGNVIIAVASLVVVFVLILFPLTLVLPQAIGVYGGFEISAVIAFFLGSLVVGYVFNQSIWEEKRTITIAKITVLFTVLIVVIVLIESAVTGDWTPMARADYLTANPAAAPSTLDWYYIERLTLVQENFTVIVLVFSLTFVGLYIGSLLKRPTQTLTPETPTIKQKKGREKPSEQNKE